MPKPKVFYSFHYDTDVFRVQQIRNIGVVEGDKPVTANEWEEIRGGGEKAIQNWIDKSIEKCDTLIVLIGAETAGSKWVLYEIEKAWNAHKKVLGIYIHNLKCPKNGTSTPGANPFAKILLQNKKNLGDIVPTHNPDSRDAYNDIANNLEKWISEGANRAAA
jgi:hypothetical protein